MTAYTFSVSYELEVVDSGVAVCAQDARERERYRQHDGQGGNGGGKTRDDGWREKRHKPNNAPPNVLDVICGKPEEESLVRREVKAEVDSNDGTGKDEGVPQQVEPSVVEQCGRNERDAKYEDA